MATPPKPRLITPNSGRTYDMGRMQAVFFADGEETGNRYSISEWSLEANTEGPGAHAHPEDHIFHVLQGTLDLVIDDDPSVATRGSYVFIPGGTTHDFCNRGAETCRFTCINIPAGFEQMMPHLVKWFEDKPLGDADPA